jgi:hypothetical protein
VSDHHGYMEQIFATGEIEVGCSCGWESTGHEDVDSAASALEQHRHETHEGDHS